MPAFTVPLHEYNDCHTPAGSPEGGQFCSKGGGAGGFTNGIPAKAQGAVRQLRSELVHASFRSGAEPHETMGVVDLTTGERVGETLVGDENSVEINKDLQRVWALRYPGPLMTAHTHPGSSTFSFDDFDLHNAINRQAGFVQIQTIQVYGEDGSWYELTFPKVFSDQELVEIHQLFRRELYYASEAAGLRTDGWATRQPWWADRPPKTWELVTDREHIRYAAEKAGQLDTLTRQHQQHFKEATEPIWQKIGRQFGIGYRSHREPQAVPAAA